MYDVFLSYNSKDLKQVTEVDRLLRARGVRTWFDKREIGPGATVWKEIDEALRQCAACILLVGEEELGHYQEKEFWSALAWCQDEIEDFRLIPVVLPGGDPKLKDLPIALRVYSRLQLDALPDDEALDDLARVLRRDPQIECVFEFERPEEGESYRVRLSVDGGVPIEADFAFDLAPESRTLSVILPKIEGGRCELDDIKDIGGQLWNGLNHGPVGEVLGRAQGSLAPGQILHLRLRLPPPLARLPWEALHDDHRIGFLAHDDRFCVVRDLVVPDLDPQGTELAEPADRLRVLTLIPGGSGLEDHREIEALSRALEVSGTSERRETQAAPDGDSNFETINEAVERLGKATRLQTLGDEVTLRKVSSVLQEQDFDVVHFVGHGRREGEGVQLRFNTDDGTLGSEWVSPEIFSTLFSADSTVRLVILNCCFSGGGIRTRDSGFGAQLLRRGVRAVITMGTEVQDQVALAFSESFYEHLTSLPASGRIDLALEQTRRDLLYRFQNRQVQAFLSPQLHLSGSREAHFEIRSLYRRPQPEPIRIETPVAIPTRLMDAFRKRRVVPVIGPGVLSAGAVRDAGTQDTATLGIPGPRQLAQRLDQSLAEEEGGRFDIHSTDFQLSESAGEWFHSTLLQRVCQFHEPRVKKPKVVGEIEREFSHLEPPQSLLRIARWPMSGAFCTFYDGLFRRAIGTHRQVLEVRSVREEVQHIAEALLLVELRGSLREPQSLVLTETDEATLLWDDFSRMSAQITGLVKGFGSILLFLGCSPREPLVLRLAHRLREPLLGSSGEFLFVTPRCSEVDKARWKKLQVGCEWILGGLEQVIETISEGLGEEM